MTELNRELLEKTMQHIVDHPDQHDQHRVFNDCGTPACFMGWAMHFSGMTHSQWYTSGSDARWAENNLGLTTDQFYALFDCSNTIPMLQLMVKDLVNGDELRPGEEYWQEAHE